MNDASILLMMPIKSRTLKYSNLERVYSARSHSVVENEMRRLYREEEERKLRERSVQKAKEKKRQNAIRYNQEPRKVDSRQYLRI